MLDIILKMLDIDKMYGISKEIDIAKGINKLPMSIKEGLEQHKRRKQWQ